MCVYVVLLCAQVYVHVMKNKNGLKYMYSLVDVFVGTLKNVCMYVYYYAHVYIIYIHAYIYIIYVCICICIVYVCTCMSV